MGELGDEGSDQYRVGEEGEHGMREYPPDAVSARGEVGLRRREFAIVGDTRRWGAATQANGASIGLAGRNIEPREVRLSRLEDLGLLVAQ